MLIKLAIKNMGKNIREYGVYFLTLIFGVCIFYMFNSIYDQQKVMVVTEAVNTSMEALRQILSLFSVFVAVVLGGLVVYANRFFIKRRKKELGIYMTLGMSKGKISSILLLETSFIAIAALIIGLILGIFTSQFMSIFTASIFEADMSEFKFVFSPDAAMKSILYFILMFIVVALFNLRMIGKYKLIDLIYGARRNEKMRISNIWIGFFILVISILCLVVAYILILKNGILNINGIFKLSIGLGIVGTVLFFFSLSNILVLIVQANKKIYFRNLNMFIARQISSKINTNFLSISVACIVLFLVIGIFSSGYSLQHILSTSLRQEANYDFSLFSYSDCAESIYDSLPENIKQEPMEYYEFMIYNSGDRFDLSTLRINSKNWSLDFILESDYNAALKMDGKKGVELDDYQYQIVVTNKNLMAVAQQFLSEKKEISLDGIQLLPSDSIITTSFSNGYGNIYFIVKDDFRSYLNEISNTSYRILNINCNQSETEAVIRKSLETVYKTERIFDVIASRTAIYEDSISSKAIVAFLAIYLGIVFMICCAAILAIQQLSEAADNKQRYELLRKIGVDDKMIEHALFMQILFYFLLPLILAMIHSAVGLRAANEVIRNLGDIDMVASLLVTVAFIVLVYGVYFILTFASSKSIINKTK